jgi:methyltransferase (TIGR00027 family)
LAEHLIAPRLRALLRNEVTRQEAVQHMERLAPGMYLYMLARTRHFDALLASELARGVKQFVILGAGLDSRAHRFAAQLNAATVFEVDHPIHAINGQSTKALR